MNKNQKEILQSQLDSEAAVLKNLQGIYKKALDDINNNISALMGRTDTENLRSIVYQINYQEALKNQINGILDNLSAKQYETVSEYLADCYEDGFVGVIYDLHGQGIPIITPINQELIVRAVKNEAPLVKPFYDYLGEDVEKLKKRVRNNISRGLAQGSSYSDISKNIARGMVGDYSKLKGGALYDAYRITRTEGHRITNEAAFDAQKQAKEKGAEIVKQWDATIDRRTRPSHARVDGEIRELDESFSNGLMYPGDSSGGAAEVINCRCALLQRAKWALDEEELKTLQERAEYFGLDKTGNFNEFKKKYLDNSQNAIYNGNAINTKSKYIGQEIKSYDNKSVREWYDVNVHDIPNQIDTTKSIEEQAQQAFELRNKYKHEARGAMSDKETVAELEKEHPAPTFEELVQSKMKRKGMTREEAVEDILKTASKTNKNVDELFGL